MGDQKQIFKVVLTGGPCAGKTTGQARLSSFFESIGWKVYTVPETASILLSPGRIRFPDLSRDQAAQFQIDLLKTLIQIENVFFNQAELSEAEKIMIILDRGAMDGSAYIDMESWSNVLSACGVDNHEMRERYHQVRLRSRSQNGKYTYTLTTRTFEDADGKKLPQPVETRKQLDRREYQSYLKLRDRSRQSIHKKRVCFVFGNVYFNLDIYIAPLPPALMYNEEQLMILETYTTRPIGDPEPRLPDFLEIEREITMESAYSMFNLARNNPGNVTGINGAVH